MSVTGAVLEGGDGPMRGEIPVPSVGAVLAPTPCEPMSASGVARRCVGLDFGGGIAELRGIVAKRNTK